MPREGVFCKVIEGGTIAPGDADRQLRLASDTSWLDFDKLAGFPEWATDLLDENPSMYGRTDFIYEGLQKRIDFLQLLFG